MRTARNTFFNQTYQPHRIGKTVFKLAPHHRSPPIKESLVQNCRRINSNRANQIYARYLLIKLRLAYMELGRWFKPMPSKFRLRNK